MNQQQADFFCGHEKHVFLGVTGHRIFCNEAEIQQRVKEVLKHIRDKIGEKMSLTVLSPLAEGADRIVAREAMTAYSSTLKVVLPLWEEEYMHDFSSEESRKEFRMLLSKAECIVTLPPVPSRIDAYEAAGRYVVAHCDILLALWDGCHAKGPGGTAEIVSFARELKKPLIWINTTEPEGWVEEHMRKLLGKEEDILTKNV